ncbi:MAG TPA: hypothetical protein VJS44_04650 [Pyrinomonadaceae bacterium]|nr:hypothetical protein [Pyrinomonadaceae bacterium]
MPAYCTASDITSQAFESLGDVEPEVLGKVAEAASRIFDRAAQVPSEYFKPAEDASPAVEKIFYGEGADLLRLPPYVAGSLTEVSLPDGYVPVEYVEVEGGLMFAYAPVSTSLSLLDPTNWPARSEWQNRRYAGWPAGVAIYVTARWGFAATPADVWQATVQIALQLARTSDPATVKASDIDNRVTREPLPPTAREVADYWKARALLFN